MIGEIHKNWQDLDMSDRVDAIVKARRDIIDCIGYVSTALLDTRDGKMRSNVIGHLYEALNAIDNRGIIDLEDHK